MEIVYLLPLVLVLAGMVIAALFWAIKTDQFDDLEGPAHRILQDDDAGERRMGRQKSPPTKRK